MLASGKIAVIGASGFIGSSIFSFLKSLNSFSVINNLNRINPTDDYLEFLNGVDVVIYCSGVAHIPANLPYEAIEQFNNFDLSAATNFFGYLKNSSVKRVIYLSSINVFGNYYSKVPLSHDSICNPVDLTSKTKLAIESRLIESCKTLDYVIIRCPLVYGPGVKANFLSLIRLCQLKIPLPLGSFSNKRSLVALDNLVDLVFTCISHKAAANKCFLVSDDNDVSTADLIMLISEALGKKVISFPFPIIILRTLAFFIGKKSMIDRLNANLQVDISFTKNTLLWKPSISVNEGIRRCVEILEQ